MCPQLSIHQPGKWTCRMSIHEIQEWLAATQYCFTHVHCIALPATAKSDSHSVLKSVMLCFVQVTTYVFFNPQNSFYIHTIINLNLMSHLSAVQYSFPFFFFLWRYSPFLGLGLPPRNSPFHFSFLDLRHSVGLLGRVISSSQGLQFSISEIY
jgi:hypothetical protein